MDKNVKKIGRLAFFLGGGAKRQRLYDPPRGWTFSLSKVLHFKQCYLCKQFDNLSLVNKVVVFGYLHFPFMATWPPSPKSIYSFSIVLCEYSKFRIKSNSYLLFDSIQNWRNYSKFSNTYLTVISRVTETRFVCTLFASHKPLHSPVIVCVPTLPTPWPVHKIYFTHLWV